jgi:hypothetical protein
MNKSIIHVLINLQKDKSYVVHLNEEFYKATFLILKRPGPGEELELI